MQRRPSNRAALVGIVLAGLVAVTAATALDARSASSAFELTVEGRDTWEMDGDVLLGVDLQWTFRSRAPFCTTGTFVEFGGPGGTTWRFTCDDGTGGLTVSIARAWNHNPQASVWSTTWRVLDGSGSYAGLRGQGSMRIEVLSSENSDRRSVMTWRSTLQGVIDEDAVAPTIAISSASPTKLRRPPGAYLIRVALSLRDDVEGNPVTYELKATERRTELAAKEGTTASGSVVTTLRVRPSSKHVRSVDLHLRASDPIGNEQFLVRTLKLPR
jgi:hypothetical protein